MTFFELVFFFVALFFVVDLVRFFDEITFFLSERLMALTFFSSALGFLDQKLPMVLYEEPLPTQVFEAFFLTSLLCSFSLVLTSLVVLPT